MVKLVKRRTDGYYVFTVRGFYFALTLDEARQLLGLAQDLVKQGLSESTNQETTTDACTKS